MKSVFLALFLFTGIAEAADTIAVSDPTSTARFDWGKAREILNANYSGLLLGPNLQSMEGDLDGRGTNLSLRNYLSLDAQVAPDWEVATGWEIRQYWRPADPRNPNRKDFDPRDPYLGVNRRNLLRGDIFSLGGRARFFLPVSNYTKSQIGRVNDSGRGSLNASLTPYWRFLDGDLGVSCASEIFYNFDKQAAANREDYSFRARPLVSYRFARKFAAKVEYQSGFLRHSQNGKWSKFNDRFLGQRLFAGVTYNPHADLSLNPSLGWGSDTFRLNRAEVSLFASYTFL